MCEWRRGRELREGGNGDSPTDVPDAWNVSRFLRVQGLRQRLVCKVHDDLAGLGIKPLLQNRPLGSSEVERLQPSHDGRTNFRPPDKGIAVDDTSRRARPSGF